MTKRKPAPPPDYARHMEATRYFSRPALAALCNVQPDLADVFKPTMGELSAHFHMWPVNRDYFASVCEVFRLYGIGGQ